MYIGKATQEEESTAPNSNIGTPQVLHTDFNRRLHRNDLCLQCCLRHWSRCLFNFYADVINKPETNYVVENYVPNTLKPEEATDEIIGETEFRF